MVKATMAVITLSIAVGAVAALIAGTLLKSGEEYADDATAFAIVLTASFIGQELLMLGAVAWFTVRKYHLHWAALGLRKPTWNAWWFPVALAAAGLAIAYGYDALRSPMDFDAGTTPDEVFESAGPFVVVAIGAVLLAPWIEEIFFRGFLFRGMERKWGWLIAAAVSSLVFALAHLAPFHLPPYAALGFLFAWSYHRAGSLVPGIVAHFMINAVTVGVGLALA